MTSMPTVNCYDLVVYAQGMMGIGHNRANDLLFRSGFWPDHETNPAEFYLGELVEVVEGWEHDVEDPVAYFTDFDLSQKGINDKVAAAVIVARFLIEHDPDGMAFLFDD